MWLQGQIRVKKDECNQFFAYMGQSQKETPLSKILPFK